MSDSSVLLLNPAIAADYVKLVYVLQSETQLVKRHKEDEDWLCFLAEPIEVDKECFYAVADESSIRKYSSGTRVLSVQVDNKGKISVQMTESKRYEFVPFQSTLRFALLGSLGAKWKIEDGFACCMNPADGQSLLRYRSRSSSSLLASSSSFSIGKETPFRIASLVSEMSAVTTDSRGWCSASRADGCELVVIDSRVDQDLAALRTDALRMFDSLKKQGIRGLSVDVLGQSMMLALFVSNAFGGRMATGTRLSGCSPTSTVSAPARAGGDQPLFLGRVQQGGVRLRALLFKYLADFLGIPSKLLVADEASRQAGIELWNIVKQSGSFYHVPVTGAAFETVEKERSSLCRA
eukprot:ANDGO_04196.mRNA.1 hypothetical protein